MRRKEWTLEKVKKEETIKKEVVTNVLPKETNPERPKVKGKPSTSKRKRR
jgi:hypothetical protein